MYPSSENSKGIDLLFLRELSVEQLKKEDLRMKMARQIMSLWVKGWKSERSTFSSWVFIKALLFHRDLGLLKALRLLFHEGFEYLFEQLKTLRLSPYQFLQVRLFISNALSFMVVVEPNPCELISLPSYLKGSWKLIDYKLLMIEITPERGFRKYFLEEKDRVFAYGLEPISQSAPSILVFMGTGYPAGQGFLTQIETDLKAFTTVGELLYQGAREKIKSWLSRPHQEVWVCGASLGGSLALLSAIDQGKNITRVDAYNPAGLYQSARGHIAFDRWESFENKPSVFVQKQGKDPVSRFGLWKKEWQILKVIPPRWQPSPPVFMDHILIYTGLSQSSIHEIDPLEDNRARERSNFWFYKILRSLAYFLAVLPIRYGLVPFWRLIKREKDRGWDLAGLFILNAGLNYLSLPFFQGTFLGTFLFFYDLSLLTSAYFNSLAFLLKLFNKHFLQASNTVEGSRELRQEKAVDLGHFSFLQWFLHWTVVFFTLMLTSFNLEWMLFFHLPLFLCLIHEGISGIKALFSPCFSQLPAHYYEESYRLSSANIHQQWIESSYTAKELNQYYALRRDLEEGKNSKTFFEEAGDLCFHPCNKVNEEALLKGTLRPALENEKVLVRASKAKIHDINYTLKLIEKIGLFQSKVLEKALEDQRLIYLQAKHACKEKDLSYLG